LKPDGSGVVSIAADIFKRGEVKNKTGGPGQYVEWDDQAKPKVTMLRSVAVDYSGASGAPALIVVADKVTGLTALSEKNWHMDLGGVSDKFTLDKEKRAFSVVFPRPTKAVQDGRDTPAPANMKCTFVLPAILDLKGEGYGKDRGQAVRAQVDRRVGDRERTETSYNKKLNESGADTLKPGRSTGKTDDILFEFDKHLDKEDRASKADGTVYMAIITIQSETAPSVTVETDNGISKARIGKRLVWFDGEKVVLSE
jgi:hypothetical protein